MDKNHNEIGWETIVFRNNDDLCMSPTRRWSHMKSRINSRESITRWLCVCVCRLSVRWWMRWIRCRLISTFGCCDRVKRIKNAASRKRESRENRVHQLSPVLFSNSWATVRCFCVHSMMSFSHKKRRFFRCLYIQSLRFQVGHPH